MFNTTLTEVTLILAALLILQCIRIYVAGTSAENTTQAGVRINDIYSREIVYQYFSEISWMVILWLVALAGTIACRILKPQEQRISPTPVHFAGGSPGVAEAGSIALTTRKCKLRSKKGGDLAFFVR